MKYIIFNYYIYYFNLFYIDGKENIQGGKEMNIGAGKEKHKGWEGNEYRVEGNTYTVERKCIHSTFY